MSRGFDGFEIDDFRNWDSRSDKLKCVMSALFPHAVRWEFCGHNPISSGIPVGAGGKRGPSTGVRVSAKRQQAPLFLSPEQVKLGLAKLAFRDQLLVFLDGALGTRRGELGALRWSDCNFDSMSFSVQHSYYWRRGGHLKATKTEASAKVLPMHLALKDALLEWKSQSEFNGFRFPLSTPQRKEAAGPCRGSQEKDPAGVREGWNQRRGMAHVSAHSRNDAGRDGRTSAHNPRLLAPQQPACDEQVSSSDTGEQTPGTREIGRCNLAGRRAVREQNDSHSVVHAEERIPLFIRGNARRAKSFERLLDPNGPKFFSGFAVST